MGEVYDFKCDCGFDVEVYDGTGWSGSLAPFTCKQCETIVSAQVSSMELFLKNHREGNPDGGSVTPECDADPTHTLIPWSLDHPICPKCGKRMTGSDAGTFD